MISVILTIFNRGELLRDILNALFAKSSDLIQEYIFVLDGCTDCSGTILTEVVSMLSVSYKILKADNVYEIRANNLGLKAATQPYVCIVQDDMLMTEQDWDRRLIKPLQRFPDMFAVTARTACRLSVDGRWTHIIERPKCRDKVFVSQVVNRGPLMIDFEKLKVLGFLDETLPFVQNSDDVDLCLKAWRDHRWRCGCYPIDYDSPSDWGSSRKGPNSGYLQKNMGVNTRECVDRYCEILQTWDYDEIRDCSN